MTDDHAAMDLTASVAPVAFQIGDLRSSQMISGTSPAHNSAKNRQKRRKYSACHRIIRPTALASPELALAARRCSSPNLFHDGGSAGFERFVSFQLSGTTSPNSTGFSCPWQHVAAHASEFGGLYVHREDHPH